ncbi:MAG: hypothetical protein RL095_3767 [Verrucomicrobiota bacterium]|jgi:hypothetical protein
MRFLLLPAVLQFALAAALHAQDDKVPFDEDFVRARDSALKQLAPGSADSFYYRILDAQLRRDLPAADSLLKEWNESNRADARLQVLADRQLLLRYPQDPAAVRDVLVNRLGVQLGHSRPGHEAEQKLPSALPAEFWAIEPRLKKILAEDAELKGISDEALPLLVGKPLTKFQRPALLNRLAKLQRSDFPGLLPLIVKDMVNGRPGFGQREIDKQLSTEQLLELAKLRPEIRSDSNWADAVLIRLLAGADDSAAGRSARLDKSLAFARPLPPAQNSAKASLLLQLIASREELGQNSPELLAEYLALPRQSFWALKNAEASRGLNLGQTRCGLPAPASCEDLVVRRQLLAAFAAGAKQGASNLAADPAAAPFLKLVEAEKLLPIYAEARLTGGCPDPETAARLLSSAQLEELKNRIVLDLLPDNPRQIAADAVPELHLAVKNAKELSLRIYKIDAAAACRRFGREAEADIELSGLKPSQEKTIPLDADPLLRQELRIKLDELKEPGIYAVDLIANGATARAFLRKGQLKAFVRDSAAGQLVTVLDEAGKPASGASIALGETLFSTDAEGVAVVPYLKRLDQGRSGSSHHLLISKGGLATLLAFERKTESADLKVEFAEAASFIPGREHSLLLRPSLSVNGVPADLKLLKNLRAEIAYFFETNKLASQSRKDLKLDALGQVSFGFVSPEGCNRVEVTFEADYDKLNGETDSVGASTDLLSQGNSSAISGLFFRRDGEEVLLEMRGANGEKLANRLVEVHFSGEVFETAPQSLKTDEQGLIRLGKVPAGVLVVAKRDHFVAQLGATATPSSEYFQAPAQEVRYTDKRSLLLGESLSLPLAESRWKPRLLKIGSEMISTSSQLDAPREVPDIPFMVPPVAVKIGRDAEASFNGILLADLSSQLKIEGSSVTLAGLEEGEYIFQSGSGPVMSISVYAGKRHGEVFATRHGVGQAAAPEALPQVASWQLDKDHLVIKLSGKPAALRLSAAWEDQDVPELLPDFSAHWNLGTEENRYLDGGRLDDESRYVLERRQQAARAGVMLARPGLLLNPRDVKESLTDDIKAFGGRSASGRAEKLGSLADLGGAGGGVLCGAPLAHDLAPCPLSFAAETPWIRSVIPDAKGEIRIPLKEIGSRNVLSLSCAGSEASWTRRFVLPRAELPLKDLRLAQGLGIDRRFASRRDFKLLAPGQSAEISALGGSKSGRIGSLAEAWTYLASFHPQTNFADFAPLLSWNKLDDKAKLEFYRKHACHEVHFFLFRRDPEFFAQHIRPFLNNLLQPSFVDLALRGDDLKPWLAPARLARLNGFEKALLAQRLQDAGLSRQLDEAAKAKPLSPQEFDSLFSAFIQGASLPPPPSEPEPAAGEFVTSTLTYDGANRAVPKVAGLAPMKKSKQSTADAERRAVLATGGVPVYEEVGAVREWLEVGYWKQPMREFWPSLASANRFWADYAANPSGQPFFSPGILEVSKDGANAALLALAALDLPFDAEAPEIKDGKITPKTPLIFAQAAVVADATPRQEFPVSLRFYRADDAKLVENGKERLKVHSGPFAIGVVYGAEIVVNNPSDRELELSLLSQIPEGAMPLGDVTLLESKQVPAYGCAQSGFLFYFPAPGQFQGAPIQVSQEGRVLGASSAPKFEVMAKPPSGKIDSWPQVASEGSPEQILSWLKEQPLHGQDLSLCAHLMSDKKLFTEVLATLRGRHLYDATLWGYALLHDDRAALAEFLSNSPLAGQVGPFLSSEVLNVDAAQNGTYLHRDFLPFLNARAFALGGVKRLPNQGLRAQYQRLLEVLRHKPSLSAEDHLELSYYLLLQDRFDEAAAELAAAPRDKLQAKIQHDALSCYLLFAQEKPQEAAKIAGVYKDYPIPHWRSHFAEVLNQAEEIRSGATGGDPVSKAPAYSAELKEGQIVLSSSNLKSLRLEVFPVDVEMLFSRKPFGLAGGESPEAPLTRAAASLELKPGADGALKQALPEEWAKTPCLLRLSGGGRQMVLSHLPKSFECRPISSLGQIQVLGADGKGLSKAYVKVYARRHGQVVFHKDGFTDLRGRFDYASLNTGLVGIDSLAVLVLSDKGDSQVLELKPPAGLGQERPLSEAFVPDSAADQ